MKPLFALVAALLVGVGVLFWALSGGETSEGDDTASQRAVAIAPTTGDPAPSRNDAPPADVVPARAPATTRTVDEGRTEVDVVPSVRVEPRLDAVSPSAPTRITGAVVSEHGPVPNARVEVINANDTLLGRTETDDTGAFAVKLTEVAEGASLRVVGYGFAPLELYVRRLRAGELRNIGNIRLQKGLPIRGKVIDSGGQPIADADVSVRSAIGNSPSNRALLSTRTGPDGRFTLRDAPLGRVRVVAQAENHGERGVETSAARTDAELMIELTPASTLVIRVNDSRGRRMANAEVRISCRDRASPNREQLSDDKGLARFEGLGAPKWDVRVIAYGYRPASVGDVDANGTEVSVTVEPWPCLEGTVVAPGGRAPPKGTLVRALPALSGGQRTSDASLGEPVDTNGNFKLCDLRPGDYVVVAEAPGFAVTRSQPVRVTLERDSGAGTIRLEKGGNVEIRVQTTAGPVSGASVELHANPPPRAALWHPTALLPAIETARTDARGNAAFEHVESGTVWVLVRSQDHLPHLDGPYVISNGRTMQPDPIFLEDGGRIHGVVTDESGQVTANSVVVITGGNLGSAVQLTSDVNGRFYSPPLPSGSYQVRARGARAQSRQTLSQPTTVELKAGEEREIQITL